MRRFAIARLALQTQAQWRQRVIGDLARPDQIPQRIQYGRVGRSAHGREYLAKERRATTGKMFADTVMDWLVGWLFGCKRREQVEPVATEQRDPSILRAQAASAEPYQLATGAQLVE